VLIGQFPDRSQRALGVVTSIALEGIAVALLWFWRRRPAYTGAVAVSLLAILPAWFFLVVDVHAGRPIHGTSDFKVKATLILLLAALGWLALFFVGPVRHQSVFVAGALLALVVIAVIQIAVPTRGLRAGSTTYSSSSSYSSGGCVSDSGSYSSGSGSTSDSGSYSSCSESSSSSSSSGSTCTGSSDSPTVCSDVGTPSSPVQRIAPVGGLFLPFLFLFGFERGKFAAILLILGLAYLGAGAVLDRRRQSRVATPLYGVALPVIILGLLVSAATDFGLWGASLLGLALASGTIWLAVAAARRGTAWIATVGGFAALVTMVGRAFGRSDLAVGFALMLLGVAVLVAADLATGRADPFPHDDGRLPGRPGSPGPEPAGAAAPPPPQPPPEPSPPAMPPFEPMT
jgi:hypothetical protein